jgi:CRP/FNR family transcriptional regulator, cyclic AMP receptor protein
VEVLIAEAPVSIRIEAMATSKPIVSGVLKGVPIFAALTDAEIESLAARTAVRSYSGGELLFSEGDPCAGLFLIASGRVRIYKGSSNGREQVLAVEGAGGSIAELPVFDGDAYPASAAALESSELLFVSRKDFRTVCLEHPEVALKVLQVVGARLRRLVGIIEELSFATVRHRLISWLLRQAETEGRATDRGAALLLSVGHQEIASQIGTVRELVSRNLTRLQAQGFISVNCREVTILDRPRLEADLQGSL